MYDKVSIRVILAGQMRVLLLYNSWDSSDYGPIKCTTKEIITIKLTNIYLEINLLIITLLYYPSATRRHGNFAGVHTLLRILLSSDSAVLINIITGVSPPHFDFVVYYVLCQC
jgi:hypothetical protein